MKVKFKNGAVSNCISPTEQKIFKSGVASGWILSFSLICDMTSDDIDKLLIADNISELTFASDESEIDTKKTICLSGYNTVSSSVIRHAEEQDKTRIEIQLIKGV